MSETKTKPKTKTATKKPVVKKPAAEKKSPEPLKKSINLDSLAADIAKRSGYKIVDKEEFNAAIYEALVDFLASRVYLRDKECRGILEKVNGLK